MFALAIAIHALYASLLLLSRFQARANKRDKPQTGGHLTAYVFLSLAFDSGMIPAFWTAVAERKHRADAVGGLLLAASLLLARKAMVGR
ncbi:MAG TPA: hypothetical protein VFS21_16275 [Roseiflexaceae bacterium]|nr:hypothetical protein [Roseiflexaceae bacterium]